MRSRGVAAAALLVGWLLPGAPAVEAARLRAEIGYGYDTNKFRESGAPDESGYVPYRLELDHRFVFAPRTSLTLEATTRGNRYEGGLREGGTDRLGAELLFRHRILDRGRGAPRVDVDARFLGDRSRKVYISRTAGEEYTVELPDGASLSLADRFNRDALGVDLGLTARDVLGFRWDAEAGWRDYDYQEDYADVAGVESLDSRIRHVELFGTRDLSGEWRVRAGAVLRWKAYREIPARDAAGDEVAGVGRRYRYARMTAEVRRDLGAWRAEIEVSRQRRSDRYDGYLDSTEWSLRPQVEWTVTDRLRVETAVRLSRLSYPRARVSYDPTRELRRDDAADLSAAVRYVVPGHGELFADWEHDDVRQQSETYSYDRTRIRLGYRFEIPLGGR